MLPDTHVKEFLHQAYVAAVAAQVGFCCHLSTSDYGVDGRITEVQRLETGKFQDTGVQFSVQLKASQNYRKRATDICYELDADAHNRMVRHTGSPIVLVLFCVPKNATDRVELTDDYLMLRRCCYWYPRPDTLTSNTSSVGIAIPRSQLFTPDACRELMMRAKNRQL